MILCSKLKNGLCKIVTKSQVVTKFNVTKSRLHCTSKMSKKLKLHYDFEAVATLFKDYLAILALLLHQKIPWIVSNGTCNIFHCE